MKKGNTIFALLAVLVILIFAFLWWSSQKGGLKLGPASRAPGYQTVSDLDNASKQLDSTNLNQMDVGINQISSDSSNF